MNRTGKILLTVAIVTTLAAVALGIGWGVTSRQKTAEAQALSATIDNSYRTAYYNLTYHVGNLSDAFNKLTVAGSRPMQMQLLGEANVHATGAEEAVGTLTAASPEWGTINRLLNQAGDYSLALTRKLQQGGSLDREERDNLDKLYQALLKLERALLDAQDGLNQEGYSFASTLGKEGDLLTAALDGIKADVDYPALIYDGPFSDALASREVKGIQGDQLSLEEAQQRVSVYLASAEQVTHVGDLAGSIPAYRFEAKKEGVTYYVDVTCQGGYLMNMAASVDPQDTVLSPEQATAIATDWLSGMGLTDMKAVWVSNYNSVYYLNYAFVQDEVIVYSDLVVVKVNAETGGIVGMEALNYLYNHTDRNIPAPAVGEAAAKALVHGELTVGSVRLALIPTQGGEERLTWEVYGTKGEDKYFVYVDATEGYEYKIMRVIDSQEGALLL